MVYEVRYPVEAFVDPPGKLLNLLPWGKWGLLKRGGGTGVWGDFKGYNLHAMFKKRKECDKEGLKTARRSLAGSHINALYTR